MNKIYILLVVTLWINKAYCQNNTHQAYKYILDYDVPESPAFTVLDANPNKVLRASAAKPVAVNLANQFLTNQKLESGVALDFNPYFTFGGGLKNINKYRDHYGLRILSNTQVSAATVDAKDAPGSLLGALGLRINLYDSKDLLLRDEYDDRIDRALIPSGAPPPGTVSNEILGAEDNSILKATYKAIKEELNNEEKFNYAFSLGAASSSLIKSSIADADSLTDKRLQVWLNGQISYKGWTLLGIAISRYSEVATPNYQLGLAARKNTRYANIILEYVRSLSNNSNMAIGGNVEVRVIRGLYFNLGISSEEVPTFNELQVRVRSFLRWNLSEL